MSVLEYSTLKQYDQTMYLNSHKLFDRPQQTHGLGIAMIWLEFLKYYGDSNSDLGGICCYDSVNRAHSIDDAINGYISTYQGISRNSINQGYNYEPIRISHVGIIIQMDAISMAQAIQGLRTIKVRQCIIC